MPPTGLDFMAAGPTPDCAPTSSQRRLPVAPSPTRRVIIHVATCQEDLSWLSCSWHPRLTIRIIHKCTRQYPGFQRMEGSLLAPLPWAPPPRPTEPCMTHITSAYPTIGRESEVFMSEIAHARVTDTADDDVHIFLQGGRDEVEAAAERHMGSIEQQVTPAPLLLLYNSNALSPSLRAAMRAPAHTLTNAWRRWRRWRAAAISASSR